MVSSAPAENVFAVIILILRTQTFLTHQYSGMHTECWSYMFSIIHEIWFVEMKGH